MQENKNVIDITKKLLKMKYKRVGIACIVFFVLVGIIGTLLINKTEQEFKPVLLFVGLSPIILFLLFVYTKAQEVFFKEYAQKIGFTYKSKGDPKNFVGSLFFVGHNKHVKHLLIGSLSNYQTQIFSYQYATGSGKEQQTHYFQVFEIIFEKPLPNFTLKEKNNLLNSFLPIKTKQSNSIRLEGDFANFFDLEVEKEFEIELLQIFTPDLMNELCEKWKHLSVESVENRMYIYENLTVNNTKELDSMLDLTNRFLKSIENLGPSFFKDVKALRDIINDNKNQ